MRWRRRTAGRRGWLRSTARTTPIGITVDLPGGRVHRGQVAALRRVAQRATGERRPVSSRRTTRRLADCGSLVVGDGPAGRQHDRLDHLVRPGVEHRRAQAPGDRDHGAVRAHRDRRPEGANPRRCPRRTTSSTTSPVAGSRKVGGDARACPVRAAPGRCRWLARSGRRDEQAARATSLRSIGDPAPVETRVRLAEAAVGAHVPRDERVVPGHGEQPAPGGVDRRCPRRRRRDR